MRRLWYIDGSAFWWWCSLSPLSIHSYIHTDIATPTPRHRKDRYRRRLLYSTLSYRYIPRNSNRSIRTNQNTPTQTTQLQPQHQNQNHKQPSKMPAATPRLSFFRTAARYLTEPHPYGRRSITQAAHPVAWAEYAKHVGRTSVVYVPSQILSLPPASTLF